MITPRALWVVHAGLVARNGHDHWVFEVVLVAICLEVVRSLKQEANKNNRSHTRFYAHVNDKFTQRTCAPVYSETYKSCLLGQIFSH